MTSESQVRTLDLESHGSTKDTSRAHFKPPSNIRVCGPMAL